MRQFDNYNFQRRYRKHPLLSNFADILPATIRELFLWMEFILHSSTVAAAGIKKLSEVPVTNFQYAELGASKNDGSKISPVGWKSILEKDLHLKPQLLNISFNTLAYGNCFTSLYVSVDRRCKCVKCKQEFSAVNLKKLKVRLKPKNTGVNFSTSQNQKKNIDDSSKLQTKKKVDSNLTFTAECPSCKAIRRFSIRDEYIKDTKKMNIVIWDPHTISLSSNPISGHVSFFYTPPVSIKTRIKTNDLELLSTFPLGIIEASLSNKIFKFKDGHIYHSRRETISGVTTAWGMPALASAMPSFMTLMVLRKANETIASDYMVPLRVIYPSNTGAGSDMYNFMGGGDFVHNIKQVVSKWKRDPGGIQIAPAPLGVETILGDGKMLSVHQEVDQLEANIANSLGIPIEFIKGGLSYTAQGSSLRLLQNQLERLAANLKDVIDFIVNRVSTVLGKSTVDVSMVPFKIIDDMQEKAAIIQLALQGQDSISKATILEMFNLDAGLEKTKILADKKDQINTEMEMNSYQQARASSIEEQAANDANMNNSTFQSLNQQALLQEAQAYADQLGTMQEGQRRSELDAMSKNNYLLYGVVKALLDQAKNKTAYPDEQEQQQG